jgi:23S rRNA A2030 N6-methylase RlmJ
LRAAGLLVINPPFGFEEEMKAALGTLESLLGADDGTSARSSVTVLAKVSG